MSTFLHALHAAYLFVEEDAVEVCKHAKKLRLLFIQAADLTRRACAKSIMDLSDRTFSSCAIYFNEQVIPIEQDSPILILPPLAVKQSTVSDLVYLEHTESSTCTFYL